MFNETRSPADIPEVTGESELGRLQRQLAGRDDENARLRRQVEALQAQVRELNEELDREVKPKSGVRVRDYFNETLVDSFPRTEVVKNPLYPPTEDSIPVPSNKAIKYPRTEEAVGRVRVIKDEGVQPMAQEVQKRTPAEEQYYRDRVGWLEKLPQTQADKIGGRVREYFQDEVGEGNKVIAQRLGELAQSLNRVDDMDVKRSSKGSLFIDKIWQNIQDLSTNEVFKHLFETDATTVSPPKEMTEAHKRGAEIGRFFLKEMSTEELGKEIAARLGELTMLLNRIAEEKERTKDGEIDQGTQKQICGRISAIVQMLSKEQSVAALRALGERYYSEEIKELDAHTQAVKAGQRKQDSQQSWRVAA